ncbi:hypothetical protein Fot_24563 [Forsythia ovata]|uniref:Uncharacterized protein n=1 Tax=Forsythia ovata TaxID=205694 RepID=A0ABD1U7U3_9LAMI
MIGFYFSNVPKLKIRYGGVVDDILLSTSGMMCGVCSGDCRPAGTGGNGLSSVLLPYGHVSPTENFRRSGKRKAVIGSQGETVVPRRGIEDTEDPRRARRGREDPSSRVKDCVLHDRMSTNWTQPLWENCLAPAAVAAASVHKYWTSTFGKAAENTELTELLKLAEMYTSRSHMLNCELYEVLAMMVDELRPMVRRDEDVEALRLENKDLWKQLSFSKDARARAIYDITKAKTIQMACVQAQKDG